MKIALYQIIPELDTDKLMFNNLSYMRCAYGKEIPAQLYEQVFCGDVDAKSIEDVFAVFNINFPKDYRGRSMSVSDVLEVIETPKESRFYYCDSVGFEEVEFDANKAMMQIQNHDFQNTFEIRENTRAFFISNDGLEDHFCSKLILKRCRYSECQLGYELIFWHNGDTKPVSRQFLSKPIIVLTKCNVKIPENLLYKNIGNELIKSRYKSHDTSILGEISAWVLQCGFTFENL